MSEYCYDCGGSGEFKPWDGSNPCQSCGGFGKASSPHGWAQEHQARIAELEAEVERLRVHNKNLQSIHGSYITKADKAQDRIDRALEILRGLSEIPDPRINAAIAALSGSELPKGWPWPNTIF